AYLDAQLSTLENFRRSHLAYTYRLVVLSGALGTDHLLCDANAGELFTDASETKLSGHDCPDQAFFLF
ncbi:MAG TPA: hypothetical protein VGZ24_10070, partial [Chthoniobacterales bacterium]|nr:hypothetical protein [Chthoniobacterales bacterium]